MKTVEIEEKEKIEAIINQCDICFVGITGLDQNPYVIPMNFGYKDGVIYLHSGPTGSSLEMLAKNNNVCITFSPDHKIVYQHPEVACSYSMQSKSVICRGKVGFIEDIEQKREILNIIMKHYTNREFTYSDPAVRNVRIWKISIDKVSAREFGVSHRDRYKR